MSLCVFCIWPAFRSIIPFHRLQFNYNLILAIKHETSAKNRTRSLSRFNSHASAQPTHTTDANLREIEQPWWVGNPYVSHVEWAAFQRAPQGTTTCHLVIRNVQTFQQASLSLQNTRSSTMIAVTPRLCLTIVRTQQSSQNIKLAGTHSMKLASPQCALQSRQVLPKPPYHRLKIQLSCLY